MPIAEKIILLRLLVVRHGSEGQQDVQGPLLETSYTKTTLRLTVGDGSYSPLKTLVLLRLFFFTLKPHKG